MGGRDWWREAGGRMEEERALAELKRKTRLDTPSLSSSSSLMLTGLEFEEYIFVLPMFSKFEKV